MAEAAVRLPGRIAQGILARGALVLLRLYLGAIFLVAVTPKLRTDFAPRFNGMLEKVALVDGHPFYQLFVRQVVQPHAAVFAAILPCAELLIGVALVLGLLTRLAAAGAILLLLNYLLAKGAWFWYPSSNDAAFILIALALLIGAAGRTRGLDALLARRWPRGVLW